MGWWWGVTMTPEQQAVPIAKYDVVLADPPWSYYKSTHTHSVDNHYKTMTPDELKLFPWMDYVGNTLFMWATSPKLEEAIALGTGIGLHFRGVSFVWVKTKKDGTLMGAMGVRPSIVKPTAEFVLAFSKAKRGRPLPLSSESIRNVVAAPVSTHSRKPDAVHERLEQMYPTATKCELFARRTRVGWTTIGDEL